MAEQPTSSMADVDANDKQVDVKVKYVETNPDEFCTKTYPTDLTLIIEDRPLLVNSSLLVNLSPVFDAMLSGDFKEKDQQTITLSGKKFNNFVEFMRCMNPRISKPVTVDNVYDVLPLAHEYEVKHLLTSCETTLKKVSKKAADELYHVLKIAIMYDMKYLTSKCIKLAADRPPGEIEEAGTTHELDTNTINAVKSQMLTNLTTKHKDIFVYITTSEALYRVLGIQSKQQNLVTAFNNGKVLGDFRKLQVRSSFEESVDMCINGNLYSMDIQTSKQTADGKCTLYQLIYLTTKCKAGEDSFARCVSGIYVRNWMDQKKDIYEEKTFFMNDGACTLILDKGNFLSEKTAGYLNDGIVDIELFLFIVNK